MCICMCIYKQICIYVHICTCTYMYIHILHIMSDMYIDIHTQYIYIYMYVYSWICMYILYDIYIYMLCFRVCILVAVVTYQKTRAPATIAVENEGKKKSGNHMQATGILFRTQYWEKKRKWLWIVYNMKCKRMQFPAALATSTGPL